MECMVWTGRAWEWLNGNIPGSSCLGVLARLPYPTYRSPDRAPVGSARSISECKVSHPLHAPRGETQMFHDVSLSNHIPRDAQGPSTHRSPSPKSKAIDPWPDRAKRFITWQRSTKHRDREPSDPPVRPAPSASASASAGSPGSAPGDRRSRGCLGPQGVTHHPPLGDGNEGTRERTRQRW